MTVYWIDPTIGTTQNGIHGTTDTTSRSGTYAAPFSLLDFAGTNSSNSAHNTVQGVTFTASDEIRIKGLGSIEDYLYDIGTSDKKITVTGITQTRVQMSSSDLTAYATYQTEMTSNSYTCAPIIYFASSLKSVDFVPIHPNNNMHSITDGIPIQFNNGNQSCGGFWQSKQGITSSENNKVGFVDLDYVIDDSSISTNQYWFQFTVKVKVTDGWTSETVQDGVTLIPLAATTSATYHRWFQTSTSSSVDRGIIDCPNLYMFYFNKTTDYVGTRLYLFAMLNTDANGNYVHVGGFCGNFRNIWNYIFLMGNKNGTESDPAVWVKILQMGAYAYWNGSGSYDADSANWGHIRIDNFFGYRAPYLNGRYYSFTVGNCFAYDDYSGNAFFANNYGDHNWKFDGVIYARINQVISILLKPPSGSASDATSTSNFSSGRFINNAQYPNVTDIGPIGFAAAQMGFGFGQTTYTAKQNTTNALENYVYQTTNQVTVQGDPIYSNIGILDTNSVDYRSQDTTLLIKSNVNGYNAGFDGSEFHFASNTYDQKPIGLWIESISAGNVCTPLISYNNSDGDLIVISNENATESAQFQKAFVLNYDDPTGYTTITFSMTIERSDSSMGVTPLIYLFPLASVANTHYNVYVGLPSVSGNVLTYTKTLNLSDINSNARHMGMKIVVRNNWLTDGSSYNSYHKLSEPTLTLS